MENYTAHLAHALAQGGYRVIVATLNTHDLSTFESEERIEVVRLPCRHLFRSRYPLPKRDDQYHHAMTWLHNQKIDYVVVNARFYLHSYEGLSFAQRKGIAPILIEHGSAHLTLGNPAADAVIRLTEHAITMAERRFEASHYGVSTKASSWLSHFGISSHGELPNSIDADAYASSASNRTYRKELELPEDAFIVSFVGRLVQEKGILELAKAVQIENPDRNIIVLAAGDGPLRENLSSYENERFKLLGKLGSQDVAALFAQSNATCLPSRSEGFATSLLEAAACWTPALTTPVGGVEELIPDGDYGTVIPNREPETIRAALESMSLDRNRTKMQGIRVGELVRESYSWSRTAHLVVRACQKAQNRLSNSTD